MALENAMDGARARQRSAGELFSQGASDGERTDLAEGPTGEFAPQPQDVAFELGAGAIETRLGTCGGVLEVGLGERLAVRSADPILERR